eukprot:TRINITY_DN3137_c0_g1_i1.p1 TRINITY_DN3137_c0_g1~~TRINITY_DN3137_c0_g1_i1.p1  ORF type:complete len:169 (-),score=44.92 TRINITY_DN3137_c0_g1_i1:64-570(-)
MQRGLVGSEMCIRDRYQRRVHGYEMLTGLPPFYTKEREKLFYNIKFAELKYPTYISPTCKDLLIKLFNKDPALRLGSSLRDAEEIKEHPFFNKIDWKGLLAKTLKPVFKPRRLAETDTGNFDTEFTGQPATDSIQNAGPLDPNEGKWDEFSYKNNDDIDMDKEMKDIK